MLRELQSTRLAVTDIIGTGPKPAWREAVCGINSPETLIDRCIQVGIAIPDRRSTITQLNREVRDYGRFGKSYRDRLACHATKTRGDTGLKDSYYHTLLESMDNAFGEIQINEKSDFLHLYQDETATFAKKYHISPSLLKDLLRTMRLDFSYSMEDELGSLKFTQKARAFLADTAQTEKGRTRTCIQKLGDEWTDRASVRDFYRALYSLNYPPIIARWLFEEIPLFLKYYEERILEKSGTMDVFSDKLLQAHIDNIEIIAILQQISQDLGYPITDQGLIFIHRNLVVYGQTTIPEAIFDE